MKDRRKIWVTTFAVALSACGIACGGAGGRAPAKALADVAPAAETRVAEARRAAGPSNSSLAEQTTGSAGSQTILSVLTVEHQVDVLAERDGVVLTIDADESARVRQGQTLAQLDDRTQRAQLAHDQADLVVANDNVKYNEAEVRAKQANYRRYQELSKYGLGSEADLEKARFEAEGAQYDLDSWRAIVKRTETQIRIAELEIGKMKIRAPFDGVVARRYVRQGQALAKGDRCFRITQLRPLRVRFPVPETSPLTPRTGDRLLVSVAAEPTRVFPARIIRVSPVIDPASASWDVLAELTGRPPDDLRPGMAVEVHWPPARAGVTR